MTSVETANGEDPRAFVAIRLGGRSWVEDIPRGEVTVGNCPDAAIRIEADGIEPTHAVLRWNGQQLSLSATDASARVYLNGKRLEGPSELKAGDELSLGGVPLVVGITMPVSAGGRRALTHHEFRERLYEELARAGRGRRPTALVMVQARTGEGARITQTALASFRAGDVLGTYAHDELEMLLPDTPVDVARGVIERLISASGAVGAVAGIAVAPEHGDNPERLLRASRVALGAARETRGGVATPPPGEPVLPSVPPEVHDPGTQDLAQHLERLAQRNTPVLLAGEVSSGKAVFARMLHDQSSRRDGPWVVVSCAAVPDAELEPWFDAEEGSPLDQARGGTLLLDEVGDLSPQGQKALRRMLERGGDTPRVVATTHRALAGLVERGTYDAGLYERLAVEVVEIPPLRNRPEDIIPMAQRFAELAGATRPIRMSPGALARLRSYPWPGNVLELRNAMERAVRLAGGGEILAEHLPSDVIPLGSSGEGRLREHVDSVERDAIVKALADANHNQTHAARRLGISRRALIYKMEKYGLKPPPGTARR